MNYIPTEQDYKDFSELSKELESYHKQPKKWEFTHNGKTIMMHRETICAIISEFLSCIYCADLTSLQRINILKLFGYEPISILKAICSDLSDNDIQLLLDGKEYPYLTKSLNAVVGDANLSAMKIISSHNTMKHVLPYKQFFDQEWTVTDKDLNQVRYELICIKSPFLRPMWCSRVPVLMEMNIDEKLIRSRDIVEVDCISFFEKYFRWNKHLLSSLKDQFGFSTIYINKTKQMKFTIARYQMRLFETYFNLKFINISKVKYKGQYFTVYVSDWYDADE